ncbi:MAG TPA: Lrp/AsnC family transcriptional regulator [Methylomusa anaerophila]|uniref:HTH-type transcriptional regulator LrpC n=1 Tax=Methylomusa anaerophila TaxID=1930071 RepID=A0A348ALU1_9FIRM|nr:Lrp/AsnC family transcriptional regulator [Methylomusa anaerophila]BBB92039.1 HTH-type transcriptional regulator LrpC [Methylomusa anaerophila]HML87949.1 Lrp/AsnC family transcriptional regulator [Methylomusa anaerophila]
MLDNTDFEILRLLKANCKMQFRDIGEVVHLTGQAVSNRISRMEEIGVIKGYSVLLDEKLLGKTITAYVTIFMKSTNHGALQAFLNNNESVVEASRISGEGCYILKIQVNSQEDLNFFLDSVLNYGNYRVNISITKIK